MKDHLLTKLFRYRKFALGLAVLGLSFFLVVHFGSEESMAGPTLGGMSYQNFEGPGEVGWAGDGSTVRLSEQGEPVHSGTHSWRIEASVYWNYNYVRCQDGSWDVDILREDNDRLVFWIYALPGDGGSNTDNTVAVKFYDTGTYNANGFEVWSTFKAHYGQWTKITILFDQLPADLDLHHINKLEFKNYWPGVYYLDDIQAIREDRVYQSFEPSKRGLDPSETNEFGWAWNGNVRLSQAGEPVHGGEYSWRVELTANWGGTGLKSEMQYLVPRTAAGTQQFWHTDLNPEVNDHLSLWVYALPSNGGDNNLNVQFYDQGNHHTDDTKVEYWTPQKARYGEWTRLTVPFSALLAQAPDLNLNDIDKIQIQQYWPGVYYYDDIEAVSSVPQWDTSAVRTDPVITWTVGLPLNLYRLQVNTATHVMTDTHWTDVYTGTAAVYTITQPVRAWYRVRAEEAQDANHEIPFISQWSDVLEYRPRTVYLPLVLRQ